MQDVRSTSVEAVRRGEAVGGTRSISGPVKVSDVVPVAVREFGKQYGRDMHELNEADEFVELRQMIQRGVAGELPPLDPR